jgi:hypothetical protein
MVTTTLPQRKSIIYIHSVSLELQYALKRSEETICHSLTYLTLVADFDELLHLANLHSGRLHAGGGETKVINIE